MTECLQTKKSNCKNCYKCIRHCPVKSLKFTDGQAHIVRDECVCAANAMSFARKTQSRYDPMWKSKTTGFKI